MPALPLVDRRQLFIDGAWAPSHGGTEVEVRNPANQDLVGLATLTYLLILTVAGVWAQARWRAYG